MLRIYWLILLIVGLLASSCTPSGLPSISTEVVRLLTLNDSVLRSVDETTSADYVLSGSCLWESSTLSFLIAGVAEATTATCDADFAWSATLDLSAQPDGFLDIEIVETHPEDPEISESLELRIRLDQTAPSLVQIHYQYLDVDPTTIDPDNFQPGDDLFATFVQGTGAPNLFVRLIFEFNEELGEGVEPGDFAFTNATFLTSVPLFSSTVSGKFIVAFFMLGTTDANYDLENIPLALDLATPVQVQIPAGTISDTAGHNLNAPVNTSFSISFVP